MDSPAHEDVLPIRTAPELARIAERLVWWQPLDDVLQDPFSLISRVMAMGSWSDIQTVRTVWGEPAFETVLDNPPAGLFTPKRWNYWHVRLGRLPTPPLPVRFSP